MPEFWFQLDFLMYTYIVDRMCILHAHLFKIRLVPDLSERNCCVYRGVPLSFMLWWRWFKLCIYGGESNENLKYILSHNLLNTKGTQWLHFSIYSPLRSIQVFQRFGSAWIPLEKNYFCWECSHSCTACCTSSSDLKDLPPIASLSGPKTWKSLGTRSGD